MLPLNIIKSAYGHFGTWLWIPEIMDMNLNNITGGDSTVTTAEVSQLLFNSSKGGVQ
jgi:hypothetical protein